MHQRREILSSQIGKLLNPSLFVQNCPQINYFSSWKTSLEMMWQLPTGPRCLKAGSTICHLNHHPLANYLKNECVIHWTEIYIQWAALSTLWTTGARCKQFYCNLFGTGNLCHKGSTRNGNFFYTQCFFLICLSFKSWYKCELFISFIRNISCLFL